MDRLEGVGRDAARGACGANGSSQAAIKIDICEADLSKLTTPQGFLSELRLRAKGVLGAVEQFLGQADRVLAYEELCPALYGELKQFSKFWEIIFLAGNHAAIPRAMENLGQAADMLASSLLTLLSFPQEEINFAAWRSVRHEACALKHALLLVIPPANGR